MKRILLLICMISVFDGCAPKQEAAKCDPNFQGSGMNVHMSFLRDNSDGSAAYLIQLCGDSKPSPIVYSVYALSAAEDNVTNPVGSVRLRQIEGSSHSGAQFEVNFRNGDSKFVIFQDRPVSTGYALDTNNELVRGSLTQTIYAGGGN